MAELKKELKVAALENGTVIDHIPSEKLFKVVEILKLSELDKAITIGNNFASKRIGKKGIIKIADTFFKEEEINRIAIVAPKAKINIIKNYEVIEKYEVELPDELCDIIKCNNPKCITNNEPMHSVFFIKDKDNVSAKCKYCEQVVNLEDIKLA
ncbi:MAG: aspartate carbamoyltransferase regulatory subunit [Bacteroidales bacterium]|nr:aspartate carbamoyltransferase regulatory subunit [Bacteroidales bacterium]MBQ7818951.1 aspartate carbamoyltransferase regulatory subunit [Bacteroidales bacterium]